MQLHPEAFVFTGYSKTSTALERNLFRLLAELLRRLGLVCLLGLGRPDDAIAGAIAALVVRRLRIALREPVVPHAATALRARLLVRGERTRCDGDTHRLLGHRELRSALARNQRITLEFCGGNGTGPSVAPRVRDRRILDRPRVLPIAVHLHPVLLVGV